MGIEFPVNETKKIKNYSNQSATLYQYSDSITVYVEKDLRNISIHEIAVGKAAVTTENGLIFTENLGPCQAVVAKLKDGNFALYHAQYPGSCEQGFKDFVTYVKNNVDEIFVFQKLKNKNNFLKAPVLAVELSIALGIDVPRIEIEQYNTIVCNARHNEVTITGFNKFNLNDATSSQPSGVVLSNTSNLENALLKAIPYHKSEEEVISYKETEGSKSYAEARLCIALSKKDFNLTQRVKTELTRQTLDLWFKDSYHVGNSEIVKNFNTFNLISNSVKIKTQPKILRNQPVADEKLKIGLGGKYRQYHLARWEQAMLAAIQKSDLQTIKKNLMKNKESALKKDKLFLLANKLHPEALRHLNNDTTNPEREKICLLIEQVAYRNKFSLQHTINFRSQNYSSTFETSPISYENTSTQNVKASANRDKTVFIHMPKYIQSESSASNSSSTVISPISHSTVQSFSTLASKQGQFKLPLTAPSPPVTAEFHHNLSNPS